MNAKHHALMCKRINNLRESITEEKFVELQECLFSVGAKWRHGDQVLRKIEHVSTSAVLFIDEGLTMFFCGHDTVMHNKSLSVDEVIAICKGTEVKSKDFKKSDLKTGMIVEIRKGTRFMVIQNVGGADLFMNESDFMRLSDYTDSLYLEGNAQHHRDYDIVAVYSLEGFSAFGMGLCPNSDTWKKDVKNILWKRDLKDEMNEKTRAKISELSKTVKKLQAEIAELENSIKE